MQGQVNSAKKATIQLVVGLAQIIIDGYQDPLRAGVLRGEIIGLSKKKLYAALLTPLFPKCLSLKKIAKEAGVSYGSLRVWKSEKFFKGVIDIACESIGSLIADRIEGLLILQEHGLPEEEEGERREIRRFVIRPKDRKVRSLQFTKELVEQIIDPPPVKGFLKTVDDIPKEVKAGADETNGIAVEIDVKKAKAAKEWLALLPMPIEPLIAAGESIKIFSDLNPITAQPLLRLVKKVDSDHTINPTILTYLIATNFSFNESGNFHDWLTREPILEMHMSMIAQMIDDLTDPEMMELDTDEGRQESGKALKGFISSILREIAQ